MEYITSLKNNRIKELTKLKDKKNRLLTRTFLVEGYHLVEEAKKHNRLKEVYTINEKDDFGVNTYIVTQEIMKKVSNVVTPPGIIGVVNMDSEKVDLSNYHKLLVLDSLQDPGNLGTLIRTSAALGIDAVIMTSDTVDVYNDKVVRSTQGAIFKTKCIYLDKKEIIAALKANDFDIVVSALKGAKNLNEIIPTKHFAVVIGNEAQGVSSEFIAAATTKVVIPMQNDVESLNASVAGGIILYYYLQ